MHKTIEKMTCTKKLAYSCWKMSSVFNNLEIFFRYSILKVTMVKFSSKDDEHFDFCVFKKY
uniref:Uncharacterized protein n=1 Tax=Strigamia maritima TaxID=126957 RepID=T1JPB7_STRMM